jgi:hypothetical protein
LPEELASYLLAPYDFFMKRFILVLLAVFSLFYMAHVCTDGFSERLIQAPLLSKTEEVASPKVIKALSQSFHYLGKGRQCFVFESLDGQYVLKFFNQKYLQIPWYAFLFPEKEKRKRQKRRAFYETSYAIAFKEFKEEILYLHSAPSQDLPKLQIQDKATRKFCIDLNLIPFVLQRKGTPFYEQLEKIYAEGGDEGLCLEIDRFLDQVALRISKKIADADVDVEHNWGYIDGKIFHLDPGRLYFDPSLDRKERRSDEWRTATHRFQKWLSKTHPEAGQYLQKELKNRSI